MASRRANDEKLKRYNPACPEYIEPSRHIQIGKHTACFKHADDLSAEPAPDQGPEAESVHGQKFPDLSVSVEMEWKRVEGKVLH